MRKIINGFLSAIIFLAASYTVSGQAVISGPTCVVPGTTYQYLITGNWDSASTMRVCLNGGVIADSTDTNTCTPTGALLNSVLVKWNGAGNGSVMLTSSSGNSTLAIIITTPLLPGSIDAAGKTQSIAYNSIPSSITCTADTGGSCSPSYTHQWQQSADKINWIDISNSTGQHLSFAAPLTQTMYYRRKVVENESGSIAYSDEASVTVSLPASEN